MPTQLSANKIEEYFTGPSIQDWAHLISFQPRLYMRPKNLDDLKNILQTAHGGKFIFSSLRVLGGLHSCSDICVNDVVIDLEDLPKTIEFNVDNTEVTVSANWHLHEFLRAIGERGKTITATGGTDRQTLAGIISTNTAPATPHHTIYELVNWVEYLSYDAASGALVEIRVEKTHPDFSAVIGSLGAIGILTKVQFSLVDQTYYETVQKIMRLKDMLADIRKTSRAFDFWRIDWIPGTDLGAVWAAKKIPSAPADGDYPVDQAQSVLDAVFRILDKFESAGPLLDPPMRLLYGVLTMTYSNIVARGPLRNMLPVDRYTPLRVAMAEWGFNPADLKKVLRCCKTYFTKKGWPNLPIEIELTKTDSYYMSAWNWPGLDYIVKFNFMYMTETISNQAKRDLMMSHLKGLWEYLLKSGIPFKAHWGKINFIDPEFVRQNYHYEQFKPFVRKVFLNPYLTDRLPAD